MRPKKKAKLADEYTTETVKSDITFPLQITISILRKLPFCKYYSSFARRGSIPKNLFLGEHQEFSGVILGQEVDGSAFKENDPEEKWFVTDVFNGGRGVRLDSNKSKTRYVNGSSITYKNGDKRVHCETLFSWKRRYIVKLVDDDMSIVEMEYKIKNVGYFCQRYGFIKKCDMPKMKFARMSEANAWLSKLLSLRPGDRLYGQTQNYTIENVYTSEENTRTIPDWLVPATHKKPWHFLPKGGKVLLPYDNLKSINRSHRPSCFISPSGDVYETGDYVVVIGPGLPLLEIIDIHENGYTGRKVRGTGTWYLSSTYPKVELFRDLKSAEEWRQNHPVILDSLIEAIRPGDLISKYVGPYDTAKSKLHHVKRVSTCTILPDIDLLDDHEIAKLDKTELSDTEDMLISVPSLEHKYHITDRLFVKREEIQGVKLLKDKKSIMLNTDYHGNMLEVEVGFLLDVRVPKRSHIKVRVERILHNGIVLDGNYYPSEKVTIIHSYFSNKLSRKTTA